MVGIVYCVCVVGDYYVQDLTDFDSDIVICDSVAPCKQRCELMVKLYIVEH
jgi:hypothetical protein